MKKQRTVLQVLFPEVRAKVFGLLFTAAPREHYVRELAYHAHLALHTIQDELRKLSAIGLVTSRSNGFRRHYKANREHELYPAICRIVDLSERLPGTQTKILRRPVTARARKRSRPPKRAHLRMPRPYSLGALRRKS